LILDFAIPDIENSSVKYDTIYSSIKSAVLRGVIKKGEKLPSIREAATQLNVSRTTVENAYSRLCIEGIAESRPNKGYFIIGTIKEKDNNINKKIEYSPEIKYDFSSRRIDTTIADTEGWKKHIREVLRNSEELTSYGDPQGEPALREALAAYSYKSRGVITKPENIVIGAGIGPLLNIICGILGRNITVGIENGSFKEAESIFSDYGIKTLPLKSDSNGATIESINKNNTDLLFLLPSSLSKISVNGLSRRRTEFADWVKSGNRFIIEDDYNGELRYTARTVPAFQGKVPESCIYIGSFSKLLLPSVRIAYMALPPSLTEAFTHKKAFYNQTCGKTEQLALADYIKCGNLEKQLRRLRRLYYNKSQILCRELKNTISSFQSLTLYESSLTVELQTTLKTESEKICRTALENGIKIMPSGKCGSIKLCFAGINQSDIASAVNQLNDILAIIV